MSSSGNIILVGNLTADPELRFTPNGVAVATISVAKNKRVFNKSTNEWEDGEPSFFRGTVWREQAENVAQSLSKGDTVVVIGEIEQENYETREGERRSTYKVVVEEIAPSLRRATAVVTKNSRSNANAGAQSGGAPRGNQGSRTQPQENRQDDNPWNSGPLDDSAPPF